MRTVPEDVAESELIHSLAARWDLIVQGLDYIVEGFGSYHWLALDDGGGRHFVTVDDLDQKGWLGARRETAFAGLRRAFDTATVLRAQGHLDFVVAPVSRTTVTPWSASDRATRSPCFPTSTAGLPASANTWNLLSGPRS